MGEMKARTSVTLTCVKFANRIVLIRTIHNNNRNSVVNVILLRGDDDDAEEK